MRPAIASAPAALIITLASMAVAPPARAGFNPVATEALVKAVMKIYLTGGDLSAANAALAAGADCNASTIIEGRNVPLLGLALGAGRVDLVTALLDAGADGGHSGWGGGAGGASRPLTPLMAAVYPPFLGIGILPGSLMEKAGHFLDADLVRIFPGERLQVIQLLVARGANLDAQDDHGETPLMHAVMSGQPAVVAELLHLGARLDLTRDDGRSAQELQVTSLAKPSLYEVELRAALNRDVAEIMAAARVRFDAEIAGNAPLPGPLSHLIGQYLNGTPVQLETKAEVATQPAFVFQTVGAGGMAGAGFAWQSFAAAGSGAAQGAGAAGAGIAADFDPGFDLDFSAEVGEEVD